VGIKSLEAGKGLVLRDQGDGQFIIELAAQQEDTVDANRS
jgi:predicted  nucleic acid-binding Zn-ribbon protein